MADNNFPQTAAKLQAYTPRDDNDRTSAILHAFLENAPGDEQRRMFAQEIDSCVDDKALNALAQRYFKGLLVPFRAVGGKTPSMSRQPYRPSADNLAEDIANELEYAKRDQAHPKTECLRRDHHCCTISGALDVSAPDSTPDSVSTDPITHTVAAHIIPFHVTGGKSEVGETSVIGSLIQRYGGIPFKEELNGEKINRLSNVLTAAPEVHDFFGRLEIWLEAVPDTPNSYYLRKVHPRMLPSRPAGTIITFSTDTGLPLPDPRFLALHAACARVLHMVEMAGVIDRIIEDWENTTVLAEDGSSAELLAYALSMAPLSVY